jgi:3-oxoadipate enol-lactonase
LIMGLGTDIYEWRTIITPLAEKYRVLAFDNRGAGRTDKPDKPYSIKMMASDTAKIMQKLKIKKANVLGISMGGRIALELALEHASMVKNLILVSAAVHHSKHLRFSAFGVFRRLSVFRSKYPQPNYAFARQRRTIADYDCTDRLSEIKVPTLIMHGKKDKTSPFKLAEEMYASIKNSELVSFKGSHLFMLFGQRRRFLDAVGNLSAKA